MSLLDDVSIVVTPNGYKAGELYAVVPVPSEGAELVTDGDFNSSSNWFEGSGCTISGNQGIFTSAPSGSGFTGNNVNAGIFTIGKRYTVVFTIDSISLGALKIRKPFNSSTTYTAAGTYTETVIATDVDIYIQNSGTTTASISYVSVKEYTAADMDVTRATAATRVDEAGLVNYAEIIGSEEVTNGDFATDTDWTKTVGWTISGGSANCVSGTGTTISQANKLIIGRQYKMTVTLTNYSFGYIGSFGNDFGGVVAEANGTYEVIGTATQTTFGFVAQGSFTGSIDNVSVKEVTRDNVPRIDYTGGGCPHILAEPQRTNLVTYSEDFSNAYWFSSTASIVSGQSSPSAANPTGAFEIIPSTSSGVHKINTLSGSAIPIGGTYTLTIYAKANGYKNLLIWGDSLNAGIGYNLEDDTVFRNASTLSHSIESFTDGWKRISVTLDSTASASNFSAYIYDNSPTPAISFVGDGTSGIDIFGASIEQGSYATSYIPTSGSTVTRNQDQFTRDGIGSLINSTEGTLFAEIKSFISQDLVDPNRYITLTNGTSNERVALLLGGNNNQLRAIIFSSSQSINLSFTISSTDTKQFNKLAIKYKSGDYAFFLNGTKIDSSSETNIFATNTLNNLSLDVGGGTQPFRGMVKQLQVYKTALTDAQLTSLTS